MLKRLTIKSKLLAALLLISTLSIGIIGWQGDHAGKTSLETTSAQLKNQALALTEMAHHL